MLGGLGDSVACVGGVGSEVSNVARERCGLVVDVWVLVRDGQVDLDEVSRTVKQFDVVEVNGAQSASVAVQPEVEHEGHLVEHTIRQPSEIPLKLLPISCNGGNCVNLSSRIAFEFQAHQRPLHWGMHLHAEGADRRKREVIWEGDNGTSPYLSPFATHHLGNVFTGVVVVGIGVGNDRGNGGFEINKSRCCGFGFEIKRKINLRKRNNRNEDEG